MEFKVYKDVNEFYDATYDLLMCDEAQNLIPLGNIIIGKKGKDKTGWRDPANWFMATVSDDNGIQLVAMMTPPHNIALYTRDNKIDEVAVACLMAELADMPLPGVIARKDIALHFAQTYCTAKGMIYETEMDQRIYELTEVNPDIAHIGTMRLAEKSDAYFIPYWLEAFYSSGTYGKTTMSIPQDIEIFLARIEEKRLYILEHEGKPVSMAAIMRDMQTVCGVGLVYTPPYFRGKGYATSCVAKLSQIILERGFTKCALYTDLANPTSNSIYQKIGYRPICDSMMLKFNKG